MSMNGSIIDALTQLGGNLCKTASSKSAADVPTSHPVGKADDGAMAAKEGEFAKTNLSDSKRTGGPLSVDNAGEGVHPKKKQPNLPQQQELNPTSADGAVPSEIKPKQTIESGDEDVGKLGGQETGGGKGEGHIGGIGGPKFANAKVVSDMDEFLKQASALIPQETPTTTTAGNATPASQTPAPAAGAEKTAGTVEDGVTQEEANELLEHEKVATALIKQTLARMNVPENAPLATKRAALVQAVAAEGEKAANGWLASMDEKVLNAITTGNLSALGMKQADDAGAAMPPSVPDSGGAASGGDGGTAAAPGGDAGAAVPGGAGGDVEQVIQQVLAAVQSGEIKPEEAMQLLQEMGVPPEVLQQLAQQLGGAAAPGGDAGAGGGAAAGAAAGAGAPPAGGDAGGAAASPESGTTV